MKTSITIFLFSFFLGVSVLSSEYALQVLRTEVTATPLLKPTYSFYSGEVKCDGKSIFFVQENFCKDCDHPSKKVLNKHLIQALRLLLKDKYSELVVVSFKNEGCFTDTQRLKAKQKKMLASHKGKVLKLPLRI